MPAHFLDYEPDDLDVQVTELLMATCEQADPLLHPKVGEALSLLRRRIGLDVVFVSKFHDGRRTYKVIESTPDYTKVEAGMSDPLEETWCQYVAAERKPVFLRDAQDKVKSGEYVPLGAPVRTYMSAPLILKNGEVYGTLCCYSHDVVEGVSEMDLRRLQITAKVLAEDLLKSGLGRELELEPQPARDEPRGVKSFQGRL